MYINTISKYILSSSSYAYWPTKRVSIKINSKISIQKYHLKITRVVKCGIMIPKAKNGLRGPDIKILKFYNTAFPNMRIYLPLLLSSTIKFFTDPFLTLPPKFSIYAPISAQY